MKIRGKFMLQSSKANGYSGKHHSRELQFAAQYDPTIPEDQKYSEATPSGSIKMTVMPSVALQFNLGHQYYVDFTPAEEVPQ